MSSVVAGCRGAEANTHSKDIFYVSTCIQKELCGDKGVISERLGLNFALLFQTDCLMLCHLFNFAITFPHLLCEEKALGPIK